MIPTRQDLTVAELASRWRCSVWTVRRLLDARTFEGVLTISRNHRLIPLASVEDYERRHTSPGRTLRRVAA